MNDIIAEDIKKISMQIIENVAFCIEQKYNAK